RRPGSRSAARWTCATCAWPASNALPRRGAERADPLARDAADEEPLLRVREQLPGPVHAAAVAELEPLRSGVARVDLGAHVEVVAAPGPGTLTEHGSRAGDLAPPRRARLGRRQVGECDPQLERRAELFLREPRVEAEVCVERARMEARVARVAAGAAQREEV